MDPLEDQLFLALEAFEAAGPPGLQRFLDSCPEDAPRLRTRLRELREAGLLDDAARLASGPPKQIDEFEVLATLGEGGMGVVYLARQPSLDRKVALKLVRPEHLLFPGARERFQREVSVVARLAHPGVVPIYSVGEAQGVPYFSMEAVEGATLAEVLKELKGRTPEGLTGVDLLAAVRAVRSRRGVRTGSSASTELFAGSWAQAVTRVMARIAEALAHAHERGVLHRDIKPANVMLTEDGRVLLLDFGLASLQGTSRLTRTGSLLGSIPYMAPEHLSGAECDARSDLWSAGVTYYELLTLHLPFGGRNDVEVRDAIERAHPEPLRSYLPAVPWEVETVCLATLQRVPAQRYSSATALAEDLRAILELRPISARRPGPWQELRRAVQRHPVRATLAATAAAALVVAPLLYGVVQRRARIDVEAANRATEQANANLQSALGLVTTERQRAEAERNRAQARADDALDAVDTFLRKVAESRLASVPGTAKLRRELLEEALRFHTQFAEETDADPRARAERARSFVRVASLRFDLGRLEEALQAASAAIALLDELAPDAPLVAALEASTGTGSATLDAREVLLQRERARAEELRGKTLAKLDRTDDALAAFRTACARRRMLSERLPDEARFVHDLVSTEISLAHAFADAGRVGEARQTLIEARTELGRALEPGQSRHWELFAGIHEGLAVLAAHAGRLSEADEALAAVQAVLEDALAIEPDDVRPRATLAGVLEQRAEIAQQSRDWAAARLRIDAALVCLSALAEQERDLPMWPSRLASLLGTSADNRAKLGHPEAALADYERAIALLDTLVVRYPDDMNHTVRLGVTHAMHAGALEGIGRIPAAIDALQRGTALLQSALERRPKDDQCRANLAAALGHTAQLLLSQGQAGRARAVMDEAMQHCRARRPGSNPVNLIELATLAGQVAAQDSDGAAAFAAFSEAATVAEAFLASAPDESGRAFLAAMARQNLGSHLLSAGDAAAARAQLELALPAARLAMRGGPSAAPSLLATVCVELASLCEQSGDMVGAEEWLHTAERDAGLNPSVAPAWFEHAPRAAELYRRLRP